MGRHRTAAPGSAQRPVGLAVAGPNPRQVVIGVAVMLAGTAVVKMWEIVVSVFEHVSVILR
ncbi:hypothetical protein ACFWOG_12420 [Kitasatospora sp. NPDC058406]|uniref:hypothetical protein n=1 Tax=Kitasatospora sp. NPDC058406 TaxID=3346483 RepID=UPI0036685849